MALIWTKTLSVGNATLDSEHKNLIGMVNSIEYAIETKDSAALLRAFKLLDDCVHAHFANEERFARAIDFSFAEHQLDHQHLQKELQHTGDDLAIRSGAWSDYVMDHYPQFLRDWLLGHITGEDMRMKAALQTRPYDFKPPGGEPGPSSSR
jgi:hemerythrin-like metal-binding protein